MESDQATFWEHLSELRLRLIRILIAIVTGVCLALPFQSLWFNLLKFPSRDSLPKLTYLAVPDAFVVRLNIAAIAGLLLALPAVIWQIWKFIVPALHENERKWMVRLSGISFLLFWAGVMFAYWVIIPLAIDFFMNFQTIDLAATITLGNYVKFTSFMLIMSGISFQIPILMVFLMQIGAVPRKVMAKNRRIVIVVILIMSALFTPPDPMTMVLLAGPFYLLFEASLLFVYFFEKKKSSASR